jgi:hypothetical protein
MLAILSWIIFGLGAFICLLNFYLSFLRYPIHRLRGLSRESYHWSSGFPIIGSLMVAISLIGLHSQTGILPASIVLIAIDTGGIHWFAGSMIYYYFHDTKRT